MKRKEERGKGEEREEPEDETGIIMWFSGFDETSRAAEVVLERLYGQWDLVPRLRLMWLNFLAHNAVKENHWHPKCWLQNEPMSSNWNTWCTRFHIVGNRKRTKNI